MRFSALFSGFLESEKAGGVLLIGCTLLSLILANSGVGVPYQHFWHTALAGQPLEYWINDGLMTIFFLLVGLELEREVYIGELSRWREAMLPAFAALGGMLVPAAVYLALNYGSSSQSGAGIPMATDIAFALAVLSLLGKRVPGPLKVFLTALAVIDDLGAILVIALFYTKGLALAELGFALGIFAILLVLNRFKVHWLPPYLIGGVAMWYFMLHSGVHATISGVLLAFAIPFGNGNRKTISSKLQRWLHVPVAFVILPLFALANTAIAVSGDFGALVKQPYSLGILLGLVLGKPIGIYLFSRLAIAVRLARLPKGITWNRIFGAGLLGGIGFTMSIFITLLAFDDALLISNAKLIIMISSLAAALLGLLVLNIVLKRARPKIL